MSRPLGASGDRPREALRRVIAAIPDLLWHHATRSFIRDADTHVQIRTQDEVADRIASILPALLAAEGYVLVELPNIDPDGYGSWSVRVPLSEQPWADGEVIRTGSASIALAGVPAAIPLRDVPAVAAALLAMHTALDLTRSSSPRYRPARPQETP
ncbi:Uncharacterised protein [Mycobacteroides abscessus subsp. abscessus]|uniref:hypothetical protein n=1 Tax=Mycobacteroides abscessus TaxID=36809 RepID=UPI0009258C67|nr:hypothetical protein [Mycobacteroides abscessus]SHS19440.1 Uncharacterised protein [Mycobacteroides abscessus subsp. abscessus]